MTGAPPIALLVDDGFDDDEVARLISALDEARQRVMLVAPFANRDYHGRDRRQTVTSEVGTATARATTWAAVVIPGGYAADRIRMRHAMLDLVREALARGAPVGAVGHGAQVLISAGVISGRTLTCWPSIAIDVKNAGGLYVDRPVVEDRGVITARKLDDIDAFVQAVLRGAARSH